MIWHYASRARWNEKGNHLTLTFKKHPNVTEKNCLMLADECLDLWGR
jgi:hypothetical protein